MENLGGLQRARPVLFGSYCKALRLQSDKAECWNRQCDKQQLRSDKFHCVFSDNLLYTIWYVKCKVCSVQFTVTTRQKCCSHAKLKKTVDKLMRDDGS